MQLTKKQRDALVAISDADNAGEPLRESNATSPTSIYWQQVRALADHQLITVEGTRRTLKVTPEGANLAARLRAES